MNHDLTPAPQSPARQATARDFLTVVFRRKWIILGLFAVVTATVSFLLLTRPVEYVSSGQLLVKRGYQESALGAGRMMGGWEEELATEAQVLASWTLRRRAQEMLDAEEAMGAPPVKLRPGGVDVKVIGQSNVIEVAYVDGAGEMAHRACKAIMEAYVEHRSASEVIPYPRAFFANELARVNAAMDSLWRLRREYAEAQNVVDVEEQKRHQLTLEQGLLRERATAMANLADETGSLRIVTSLRDNPDMDMPVTALGFLNEDALKELKKGMVLQETRIAQLTERYREDAPEVQDARSTLESMRLLLKREVEQRLKLQTAKVQGLQSRVGTLDRQIAGLREEIAAIPAKERRIGELDQEISVLKARYLDLAKNSDQAMVTEQTSRRVTVLVLSPASAPRARATTDYVRLALAPALSLLVGIGLAFFVDGLDTRLRTPGDVEDTLDLPVLATLTERKR
jgi:uncharacterized protein involved in exopolysaccharide biosynthesis